MYAHTCTQYSHFLFLLLIYCFPVSNASFYSLHYFVGLMGMHCFSYMGFNLGPIVLLYFMLKDNSGNLMMLYITGVLVFCPY